MLADATSTYSGLRPLRLMESVAVTMTWALGLVGLWSATAQEWTELPDMPEGGKWETGAVALEGKLYFFGGFTGGNTWSSDLKTHRLKRRVDVFNTNNHSWTQVQDMPSAVSHLNAVLDGRTVWFAGGAKTGGKPKVKEPSPYASGVGHPIREVWSYDIDKDRYTIAPMLPGARGGGGLALVGRNLHFLGGFSDAFFKVNSPDHWILDLDEWAKGSAQWKNAAPLPAPRDQFGTVSIDGRIYAIGGQFSHGRDTLRVDIYDPKTDSWSSGPPLPKEHSHAEAGTFVHGGRIYIVGGHTLQKGKEMPESGILALTPGGEWEVVGQLPKPLSSPAARIVDGKLYVSGGSLTMSSVNAEMWVCDAP